MSVSPEEAIWGNEAPRGTSAPRSETVRDRLAVAQPVSELTTLSAVDRVENATASAPRCSKHDEQMILSFYDRPGSAPGNGWACRSCAAERASIAPATEPVPKVVEAAQTLAQAIASCAKLKQKIIGLEAALEFARNELTAAETARVAAQNELRKILEEQP